MMIGKIRCEEEYEKDFSKLRGLHGKRSECEPVLIAANGDAKEQRQKQNDGRRRTEHIGIGEHPTQPCPKEEHQHPRGGADTCPAQLCGKEIGLQPRHLDEPHSKKCIGKGKRYRVQMTPRRQDVPRCTAEHEDAEIG